MAVKTNFSFELYYPAQSASTAAQRHEVMRALGPSLQALLALQDSAATVTVSDSHKGDDNKIVELVTSLQDAPIAEILKGFCDARGLSMTLVE